ncbi:MAG TPA: hypothetical protein VLA96_06960 [Terriglobales bacterium]|jgi:hypothetical protein|nr:hypothetical protein [Terriglobales bacterium]
MKVGAENRTTLIAAVVLAVLALAFGARMVIVLSEGEPAKAATPSTAQQAPQARRMPRASAKLPTSDSLDPTLRLEVLRAAEATEYQGSGRNIFDYKSKPIPQVVVNPGPKQPPPPQCPGDPRCPPPPIPLTFYGFASRPGEPKKIFLSSKETGDLFVAGEGEIVNRRYRVLRIGVNSVEIEDVLSNNRQTIPLTQG